MYGNRISAKPHYQTHVVASAQDSISTFHCTCKEAVCSRNSPQPCPDSPPNQNGTRAKAGLMGWVNVLGEIQRSERYSGVAFVFKRAARLRVF